MRSGKYCAECGRMIENLSSLQVTFMVKVYLPKARPNIALSSVPNGHEFYAALLKYHTTTDFSPQQVHHIGLSEVKRINTRMELVRKTVGFNGTLGEFRKYLRTDKKFGFRDAEHMLKYFNNLLTKVKGILPKYFSSFPNTPFVIRPVPVNLQVTSPLAYYEPPTFKEGKGERHESFLHSINILANIPSPPLLSKIFTVLSPLFSTLPGTRL